MTHRSPELRLAVRKPALILEPRRHHADDRIWLRIQQDLAANDAWGAAVAPLPDRVHQDHGCRRIRPVVGLSKTTPQSRLHAQRGEEVPRAPRSSYLLRKLAAFGRQVELLPGIHQGQLG